MSNHIIVALAQMAPVWLNKKATMEKMLTMMDEAALHKADLIAFGESLLPGYPFWLALAGGAQWNTPLNKVLFAHYYKNSICIEDGDLDLFRKKCKQHQLAAYIGIIERPRERGKSLYCSLVYINKEGQICSCHRKLQPTYDERLVWSPGDGHGLITHPLEAFTVGGLNCWENWMPLSRTAIYAMGEDLHVAVWPGSIHNTQDITRFMAREGRSYVISVSGLMRREDFPRDTPYFNEIMENCPEILANGGSCIASPDGEWVLPPIKETEGVFTHVLDFERILEERMNFDPVGHYSRPDVTRLMINRERQRINEENKGDASS